MEVIPAIRTAWTRETYAEYLLSATWKTRRNQALRDAFWQCAGCGSKRALQVHHLSYERLGAEWNTDLQVLCVGCHEDAHPAEAVQLYVRLYIKLAREVLAARMFESEGDFLEAVKVSCARKKIPYNTEKLARAIGYLLKEQPDRILPPPVVTFIERQEEAPIGPDDARQFLKTLGLNLAIKTMPAAKILSDRAMDRYKAAQIVAQAIADSIYTCEALEREADAMKRQGDDDQNL